MEQTSSRIARSVPGCLVFHMKGDLRSLLCLQAVISPVQAALQEGSTDPCYQPLTSQGYAEVVRSETSFLLLQTLTQACLTGYTIINHGWSAGCETQPPLVELVQQCSFLPLLSSVWSILMSVKRNVERSISHVHNIKSIYHTQEEP